MFILSTAQPLLTLWHYEGLQKVLHSSHTS